LALAFALAPISAHASITKRFNTSDQLVVGSLVSVSATSPNTVMAATTSNSASLYGVVTEVGTGAVEVANTESTQTLVSTINGNIKAGDPITASPLGGVGQRATVTNRIVGYAQAPFTSSSPTAKTETFKDEHGNPVSVSYGSIPVILGVSDYLVPATAAPTPVAQNGIPKPVQTFFNSVAGHEVVPNRIILALFLISVAIIVMGVMVSTAVRRSLTAIGRNPLSSHSLIRALTQVVFAVIALLGAAMGGAYLIVTH
jgi:hypothetical protein